MDVNNRVSQQGLQPATEPQIKQAKSSSDSKVWKAARTGISNTQTTPTISAHRKIKPLMPGRQNKTLIIGTRRFSKPKASAPIATPESSAHAIRQRRVQARSQLDPKGVTSEKINEALNYRGADAKHTYVDGKYTSTFEKDGVKYQINVFDKGAYNGPKKEGFEVRLNLLFDSIKAKHPEHREKLDQLHQHYQSELKEATKDLDYAKMQDPKEAKEHYTPIHAKGKKIIAQSIADIEYVTEEGIKEIENIEKSYVAAQGRPVIINVFQHEGRKFVSAQIPETNHGKAMPSTVRDREGLSNYVTTAFGELKEDGVEVSYQATRHSSIPPIGVKDPIQRQAIAIKNVKQSLTDYAEKVKATSNQAGGSKDQPIVINSRSMMLLTPFKGDKMRGKESEIRQLKESVRALSLYHNQTINLGTKKQPLWVKVDASMMNLGANVLAADSGVGSFISMHDVMDTTNVKGFMDFMNDTSIHEYLGIADYQPDPPTNTTPFDKQIEAGYQRLNSLYKLYEKEGDNTEVRAEIDKCTDSIKKLEGERTTQMEWRIDEERKLYQGGNRPPSEARVRSAITDPEKLAVFDAYCQAKEAFLTGKTVQKETLMEFQKLYIFVHSKVGNHTEFFCKSGEDRTGRVDNLVQEIEMQRLMYGNENITREQQDNLALSVHYGSASQSNTEWNSGARGLQVAKELSPDKLNVAVDKMHSTLAKKVFKAAEKEKPSELVTGRRRRGSSFKRGRSRSRSGSRPQKS